MGSTQVVDVAIIGAGWYGLAAAKTFLTLKPAANILILDDDDSVGGVWSKKRLYPNLVAQVKLGLFNYSDLKMPADQKYKDDRVSGAMIHSYMQQYAEHHDLLSRIRFNSFVESATRCPLGWRLTLRNSKHVIEARKLMVCTGVTSIPFIPSYPSVESRIPILHSKDLGQNFSALRDESVKNVVVVGAAKSAYDVVYLLLSMGKKVTWVIRQHGAGPLAILPSKVLGLFNSIAVASTRLMTHLSPSILNTHGLLYWALQRSHLGVWTIGKFWDTLSYLADSHAGYDDGDHIASLRPEISRQSVFWANSGLGVVTLPDFWNRLHSGDLEIKRDVISSLERSCVRLAGGDAVHADSVVLCTGWSDHFGMFNDAIKNELGLPIFAEYGAGRSSATTKTPRANFVPDWTPYDEAATRSVDEKLPFLTTPPKLAFPDKIEVNPQRKWRLYRRCVPVSCALTGDRSITIMGQIHTVQTPLVAEVQCFWAVLYLLGEVAMPSQDEIMHEVAEWNDWTRKRYLSQGQKFPYSLYDFIPYIDTLFSDLGIERMRKGNAVAELFAPYRAEDYKGFIEEYLEGKRQAQKPPATASK